MSSILTNVGAMAALQTLNATNKALTTTQNRISSGMRVESAKDNSSSWSIATTMRGDVSGFKAIADNLALSESTVSVAREASETVSDLLTQIKSKVVLANSDSVDTSKIQDDIDQLVDQITNVVGSAQFNGVNLVDSAASVDFLASLDRSGATVTVSNITFNEQDLRTGAGGGLAAITSIDVTTAAGAAAAVATIETAVGVAVDAAASFGAVQGRVSIQRDFVSAMADAMTAGVGSLVDANMEEEAARLTALQTQQQLGIQGLSIANAAPQNILALCRYEQLTRVEAT
jgi:flagellin